VPERWQSGFISAFAGHVLQLRGFLLETRGRLMPGTLCRHSHQRFQVLVTNDRHANSHSSAISFALQSFHCCGSRGADYNDAERVFRGADYNDDERIFSACAGGSDSQGVHALAFVAVVCVALVSIY
jgi:hypothetical protein